MFVGRGSAPQRWPGNSWSCRDSSPRHRTAPSTRLHNIDTVAITITPHVRTIPSAGMRPPTSHRKQVRSLAARERRKQQLQVNREETNNNNKLSALDKPGHGMPA